MKRLRDSHEMPFIVCSQSTTILQYFNEFHDDHDAGVECYQTRSSKRYKRSKSCLGDAQYTTASLSKNPPPTNAPVNVYSKRALFYNKKSSLLSLKLSPRSAPEVIPALFFFPAPNDFVLPNEVSSIIG
uniref:Uncharacterized protein n=1 Tax=Glossina pallidipes TaxID=7398 RepID=A0A1A9ZPL4_GLOPL